MKYIFTESGNNAVPTGYAIDPAGAVIYVGFEIDGKRVPAMVQKSKVLSRQDIAVVTTGEKFNQIIKQNNSNKMDRNFAILNAENVSGKAQAVRMETPEGGGTDVMVINVVYDYTSPTAPGTPLSVLIGDAFDMIKSRQPSLHNLAAAKANGLVEAGTFGSSTTDILRKMSTKGVRFHIFQGEAGAASYWTNKVPARLLTANVQGSAQSIDMNFSLYQDGSQFNDKIRQIPNFRWTISEFTAIQISVNDGEYASFNFHARSTGAANLMELTK